VRIWILQNSNDQSKPILTELTVFDYGAPVYVVTWSPDSSTIAYGGEGVSGEDGRVEISDIELNPNTAAPVVTKPSK
jgi:WD40 repeat protein